MKGQILAGLLALTFGVAGSGVSYVVTNNYKQAEIKDLNTQVEQVVKANDNFKEENSSLKNTNSTLTKKNEQLSQEYKDLEDKCGTYYDENEKLSAENSQLQTEKDKLEQERNDLQTEKDQLANEKTQLEQEKEELANESTSKNDKLNSYEDLLSSLKNETKRTKLEDTFADWNYSDVPGGLDNLKDSFSSSSIVESLNSVCGKLCYCFNSGLIFADFASKTWHYVDLGNAPDAQLFWTINNRTFYMNQEVFFDELNNTFTFSPVTFTGANTLRIDNRDIWTDGLNYFYTTNSVSYKIDLDAMTFTPVTFNGFTPVSGRNIVNILGKTYYKDFNNKYEFNKNSQTWVSTNMFLTGDSFAYAWQYWSDGINNYLSSGTSTYILNTVDNIWESYSFKIDTETVSIDYVVVINHTPYAVVNGNLYKLAF